MNTPPPPPPQSVCVCNRKTGHRSWIAFHGGPPSIPSRGKLHSGACPTAAAADTRDRSASSSPTGACGTALSLRTAPELSSRCRRPLALPSRCLRCCLLRRTVTAPSGRRGVGQWTAREPTSGRVQLPPRGCDAHGSDDAAAAAAVRRRWSRPEDRLPSTFTLTSTWGWEGAASPSRPPTRERWTWDAVRDRDREGGTPSQWGRDRDLGLDLRPRCDDCVFPAATWVPALASAGNTGGEVDSGAASKVRCAASPGTSGICSNKTQQHKRRNVARACVCVGGGGVGAPFPSRTLTCTHTHQQGPTLTQPVPSMHQQPCHSFPHSHKSPPTVPSQHGTHPLPGRATRCLGAAPVPAISVLRPTRGHDQGRGGTGGHTDGRMRRGLELGSHRHQAASARKHAYAGRCSNGWHLSHLAVHMRRLGAAFASPTTTLVPGSRLGPSS